LLSLACSAFSNPDLSPRLKQSDKKFFGKDYPWDKRPPVDTLHFKHPYPAVQDSGDFDRDYVKDENSDNGYWEAQTEYDRLRHKLRKQKTDVVKAEAKKAKAEARLQDAMKKMKAEEDRVAKLSRDKVLRKEAQHEKKDSQVPGGGIGIGVESATTDAEKSLRKIPGSLASPGAIEVATDDTQKAMDDLEDCKKELAAAREHLKKLLKELEDAKKAQIKTQEAMEVAASREKVIEREQERHDRSVKDEYEAYMDARTAYLKQQAEVAKLEQDIKIAAERVRKMRVAEDSDGGVYNKGEQKSSATSATMAIIPVAAAVLAWLGQ